MVTAPHARLALSALVLMVAALVTAPVAAWAGGLAWGTSLYDIAWIALALWCFELFVRHPRRTPRNALWSAVLLTCVLQTVALWLATFLELADSAPWAILVHSLCGWGLTMIVAGSLLAFRGVWWLPLTGLVFATLLCGALGQSLAGWTWMLASMGNTPDVIPTIEPSYAWWGAVTYAGLMLGGILCRCLGLGSND